MEWFSKGKEKAKKNIKIDSGYDIFSEENTKKISNSLSNMSILLGNGKKEFLGEKQIGNFDTWTPLDCVGIKTFLENSGVDNLKNLGTAFEALGEYQNSKIGSQTVSKVANKLTFGIIGLSNERIKSFNNLLKPENIEKEGGLTTIVKTEQQNIINQNLSAFNGEENAPRTIKINGTVFSPQKIAEAIGGGKSLNEFISKKDELFKQSEKEDKDKSEDEKNADVIRGRLSGGLALLAKYSGNLDINKLSNLLETCEKDFGYFDKNKETNFFKDLENLKELEQKIQQEKERQERQEIDNNIKNLKEETEKAANREKQRQQQLLNQAKVDTYNKLYNGVEGEETSPAKSFNGENFYKDETNKGQTKIEDAKLELKSEKLNQYNNKIKDFTKQLEENIKNSENLESLEKNKEFIEIMGELSNNARELNEKEHKIKGDYDKAQESLDNIKKKVQKNLLLLDEYSQNTSKEFSITQEEIEEDIEGKTIESIEEKIKELKKEREEIINDFIKDCEKVAKEIDTNKKENDEKIAEIRNDINNIDDSDINSFNEETKKKTEELKSKKFFEETVKKEINNFEDYGLEDIDRDIARLEKQKELVQERDKAVAPKESTLKSPTVESEAAKAAKILNEKGFGRFASNGKEFTENDMTPENFEMSIRPILEEFNESFKNGVADSKNPMYKIYKDSTRLFDNDLLKNGHINIERENNTISKITIKYPKNHPFYSEYPEGKFEIENKDILSSEQIGHISMYTNENVKNRPLEYVRGVVELGEYIKNNVKQKEKSKENTTDRDISITPESNEPKQSIILDDDLNQAKVEARNDLVRRINSTAEIATNFHNGEFYKGDEIKDENKLSTDKSNVGINNTDNAINCIIEQNVENIVKSKNKKEVEEFKKNNIDIGEFYNKTVELKKGKDDFNKRYTEAQENLKQISDTVDKNLESFNEFCDNSKKEVENPTKEINEIESSIIKTEAEANKRIEELEEERKRLIEEFNEASEKSKEEIEEKQSSNDRIKEGTEMYVKSIGDGVSKENSLQENLESLKKDNIDEKIEMTKAEFSKDQEIPNFEDYKNRINEIDQRLASLEKIKENLKQQEQENQEIDQPEPEPRETQQPEPRDVQLPESEENKEDLRVKIFNGWNNSIENGSGTAEKYEDEEFRDKDGKVVAMQKTKGGKWLGVVAKEFDTIFEERFINKSDSVGEDEKSRKKQEGFLNSGLFEEKTKYTSYSNETIQNENNLDIASEKINNLEESFKEDFETKYNNISVVVSDPKKYSNKTKEELETMETNIKNEKQDLKNKYEEIKKEIENKKNEILEKTEDVKNSVNDINEYTEKNDLLETDVVKELNSKVEILNNKLKYDFKLDDLEMKKQEIEAKMAELAVNEKEIEIAQSQTISTPQQDIAELNLDDEVKAIADTKENSKNELIENNVKLEDKCEQIYKQKGIENDKEKQYDVKCEELQKSINKLSDDQKKQYSERMEELIGYSLDMGVNKEKREKIDIDLCEKQRLYIKNNTSNVKDAGVGVKVTDLSENYRRTVGQKSVGLVATVDNIDPKEFYKEGGIPKDVDVGEFNFARFTVQSIAEDKDDNYKGYKIDLKLPKDNNTVDIMANIRELGFEKAMEKYKDAGLEVNVRDSKGELLDKNEQKEFFEKLQPKDAEKSVGLEEQKQKINDESLSKEEREEAEKKYNKIMSNDDSGIKPTIQADEEDPLPEVQQGSLSQTLPAGSNFRVQKSNSPKQQKGKQNMPENENKNNSSIINQEVKKTVDNNCPGLNEVQVKDLDSKTPLPKSQNISAGQGKGANQDVNRA